MAFFRDTEIKSRVCGSCGIAFAGRASEAESRVRAMAAAMQHRGPDEDGFLVNEPRAPGLALGMRRLSIIDLKTGHQPAWNGTGGGRRIVNIQLSNHSARR